LEHKNALAIGGAACRVFTADLHTPPPPAARIRRAGTRTFREGKDGDRKVAGTGRLENLPYKGMADSSILSKSERGRSKRCAAFRSIVRFAFT
jgi:hypothetical protein